MRVLLLTQYWYPENGVPQRRWAWLTKHLVASNIQVTVIAPPPHYERQSTIVSFLKQNLRAAKYNCSEGYFGENLIRSPYLPAGKSITARALNQGVVAMGSIFSVLRLALSGEQLRPDIVIGTVPAIPTSVVTWVAAKVFRVPYVIDLRDAWPELLEEAQSWNSALGKPSIRQHILSRGPLQILSFFVEKVVNHILRSANGILTTADHLTNRLTERFKNEGNSSQTVKTVRNAFPPETMYVKTSTYSTVGTPLRVLYAGTLGRAQDLENVLLAYQMAKQRGIDIELRMVGAGAARSALERRILDLGLDLEIEPRRDAAALEDYYEWADTALVHLAEWPALSMAVPSKTYELMGARIHITAVVQGETAELISGCEAGIVVPPAQPENLVDAWSRLVNDRSLLDVGDGPAEWVEKQSTEVAPSVLLEVLNRIKVSGRNE